MLEDDGIARHERGHDAVHSGQQGVVPRRDGQGYANRFPANETREARLRGHGHRRERLARDCDHVTRSRLEAGHFSRRVSQGPTHLDRDGARDLVLGRHETVDGFRYDAPPFDDAQAVPGCLGALRAGQRLRDLRFAGVSAANDLAAVDGTDGGKFLGHGGLSKRIGWDSDDLEVARQLPVGHVAAELPFFPFARGHIMFHECVAEQEVGGLGFPQPLRGLP
ncbi:hypothetical protein D3C85_1038650 [compost metagenome]